MSFKRKILAVSIVLALAAPLRAQAADSARLALDEMDCGQ